MCHHKTMGTIDVFMRRILDYAGMFPPANLALDAALREFRDYQRHSRSDFLGRFVIPLNRLEKVADHSGPFTAVLRASALTMVEARAELERQAAFGQKIDSLEIDLPADADD